MTNEEKAIDTLFYFKMHFTKSDICRKHFDMAIKALEQQTCEDCISREDAINAAIDAVDEWDGGCNTSRATMISHAIKHLPSVTPKAESEDEE